MNPSGAESVKIHGSLAVISLVAALLFGPAVVNEPDRLERVQARNAGHQDRSNSSYPVYVCYWYQTEPLEGRSSFSGER